MTIATRVEAGAAFLDSFYGKKWRRKVKLRMLCMGDPCHCVLGQTDTRYIAHRDKLGLDEKSAYTLGFTKLGNEWWYRLTAEWKKALRGRK